VVQRNGGKPGRDHTRPERDPDEPVIFVVWPDPRDPPLPIRTNSQQMRNFWTPSLGTLVVDIAQRVALYLEDGLTVTFTWAELAATFGVGGNLASIRKALDSLQMARFMQLVDGSYQLRLTTPKLAVHHAAKLPEYIAGPYNLLCGTPSDVNVIDLRDHQRRP